MTINYNPILDTDVYKSPHWLMFPSDATAMFSYIESRGGEYDETVMFGLQYIIKKYLTTRITQEMVDEAAEEFESIGVPFNREGWEYIANDLEGKIPLLIKSLPEGSVVRTKNVLVTIESTDEKVFWVVGWFETMLLRVWYPITVATRSYKIKKIMKKYIDETSDNPESIAWKLHDFGARGATTLESSEIGGLAHLVNFFGSDTTAAIRPARQFYSHKGFLMGSIPASEHSTVTSWGVDGEADAYRNMLETFSNAKSEYKTNIFACVSDAYDIFHAIDNIWGKELYNKIVSSDTLVAIRPDSGDPLYMVMMTLDRLEKIFGTTKNSKGYKVLNHVRVVQGDGVDEKRIEEILGYMQSTGYSIDNIVFGMGGALLQKLDRDTQKFALKCSSIKRNGVWEDVYKSPITDKGKTSKKGRLDVIEKILFSGDEYVGTEFVTLTEGVTPESLGYDSALDVVFENGDVQEQSIFNEVRERANINF